MTDTTMDGSPAAMRALEAPTPAETKGLSKAPTLSGLRLPQELEDSMDASFDAIPNALRSVDEIPSKAEQREVEAETPPDATDEEEQPTEAVAPASEVVAKEADPAVEAAIAALVYDGVPQAIIEGATKEQLLAWGPKAKARQDSVAAKLKERADEVKRAQESAPKTTEKTESSTPTVDADLDATLQAFKPYGDDFEKAQSAFGRAAIGAARKQTMAEIQPAVAILAETQSIVRELLNENMRREFGERFAEPVRGARLKEAEATALRLWKANPDLSSDSSRSFLERYREVFSLACKTLADDAPKPRDEGKSRRQAQGLPSSPGKKMPAQAKNLDQDIDAGFEEVSARWASR